MKQKLVAIDQQTAWGWCAPSSLEQGLNATYDYYLAQVVRR